MSSSSPTNILTGAAAITVLLARHPELADSAVEWSIAPDGTVNIYLPDEHGQAGLDYVAAVAKALRKKPTQEAEFRRGYGENPGHTLRVRQLVVTAGGTGWNVAAYLDLDAATEQAAEAQAGGGDDA